VFYPTSVVIFTQTHGERHPAAGSSEDMGLFALEPVMFWLSRSPESQQTGHQGRRGLLS